MDSFKRNSILLLSLVVIDQVLKALVAGSRPSLDTGLVWVHYVTNTGASFGIFQDSNTILAYVSLMALGFIMLNAKHITSRQEIPAILIVSGLLGNLIDRLARRFVVDFIDVKIWPVFNLADSLIVIGVILLGITIIMEAREDSKKESKSPRARNLEHKKRK
jgi:signal peptidase II